jgi:hypothetical protein
MSLSKEELKQWKLNGYQNAATHLVVMRELLEDEEYPLYLYPHHNVTARLAQLEARPGEEIQQVLNLAEELKRDQLPTPYEFTPKTSPSHSVGFLGQRPFPESKFPRSGAEAIYLRRQQSIARHGYTFQVDKESFGNNPIPLMQAAHAYLSAAMLLTLGNTFLSDDDTLFGQAGAAYVGWPFDLAFWKPYPGAYNSTFMDVGEMIQACLEKAGVFQAAALDLFVPYDEQARTGAADLPSDDPEFPITTL